MKTNLRKRLTRYRCFIRPKVHLHRSSPLRNVPERGHVSILTLQGSQMENCRD